MKKSNIILLGIFGILLITSIALQFRVKSYYKTIEHNEIELSLNYFNEIVADKGWHIELYKDTNTRITINSDSIKSLISVNHNKLILKAPQIDKKDRMVIKIYNPDIHQLNFSGNSRIYYYIDSIDSLNINLKDKSHCILFNKKEEQTKLNRNDIQGKIDHLNVMISDKSSLYINCNLSEIQGELKDSSFCRISGEIRKIRFDKSQNAKLNIY